MDNNNNINNNENISDNLRSSSRSSNDSGSRSSNNNNSDNDNTSYACSSERYRDNLSKRLSDNEKIDIESKKTKKYYF